MHGTHKGKISEWNLIFVHTCTFLYLQLGFNVVSFPRNGVLIVMQCAGTRYKILNSFHTSSLPTRTTRYVTGWYFSTYFVCFWKLLSAVLFPYFSSDFEDPFVTVALFRTMYLCIFTLHLFHSHFLREMSFVKFWKFYFWRLSPWCVYNWTK